MEIKFKDGTTQEVDLNDAAMIKAAIMVLFAPTPEDYVVLNALVTNLEQAARDEEMVKFMEMDRKNRQTDPERTEQNLRVLEQDNIEP